MMSQNGTDREEVHSTQKDRHVRVVLTFVCLCTAINWPIFMCLCSTTSWPIFMCLCSTTSWPIFMCLSSTSWPVCFSSADCKFSLIKKYRRPAKAPDTQKMYATRRHKEEYGLLEALCRKRERESKRMNGEGEGSLRQKGKEGGVGRGGTRKGRGWDKREKIAVTACKKQLQQ